MQGKWTRTFTTGEILAKIRQGIKGFRGAGDFLLAPDGRISRANGTAGLAYLGAQILLPRGIEAIAETVFSLNILWDQMIAEGRAFGALYKGGWCDVGRPEGIAEAEAMLKDADVH